MWDELGIAPCDDPKAIRRAYAARLKKLDPDRDPEGFARLRRAFEWALAHGAEVPRSAQFSSKDAEVAEVERDADLAEEAVPDAEDAGQYTAERAPAKTPPADRAIPLEPEPSDEWVRERALIIALDSALRQRAAELAIKHYYRAAATGALSLEDAPGVLDRVLEVAVDERRVDAAAFRRLVRTAGLDEPRLRTRPASAVHQRVLARLAAENWYDELLAAAAQRKGRVARRRSKIARYLLGRIGRYWHPTVDWDALKSWVVQYRAHQAWLDDRIDPAWIGKIEGRLRRRKIFGLSFSILLIGSILLDFVVVSIINVIDGTTPFVELAIGLFLAIVFGWLLKVLGGELITLVRQRIPPV